MTARVMIARVMIARVMMVAALGVLPAACRSQSADVRRELFALAADSMEGRGTATAGGARAARFIAGELERYGISPAGDSGYFQHVPTDRGVAFNVIGMIRGADPVARDSAVVMAAHYDHLGIGRPVAGDSIYNGADDDASGVVAVLQTAHALAGSAPRRSIVFLLTTGEEVGLLGTRRYLEAPVVPLDRTVAELEVEMIGRPDSLAGGPGHAWLTGYERSTMGDMLKAAGSPVVPDPRPDQQFFLRSDNIAFARRGIPAHTLSSFNLHADYHQPGDEADRVDIPHMTAVIAAATAAVRGLANGPVPVWKPGGRPAAQGDE
jgi:Zn-dependent M28 family amino/carboxypeptidase